MCFLGATAVTRGELVLNSPTGHVRLAQPGWDGTAASRDPPRHLALGYKQDTHREG